MEYRVLGRTGIKVSAVAMGCEGFAEKSPGECEALLDYAMGRGINFFDIYTSDPELRGNLGEALQKYPRESFVIQGHLCSAWRDGQYYRTRKIEDVKRAFEDLLRYMQLSYVDVGMIHYCDDEKDYNAVMGGEVLEYAKQLKARGVIGCIGLSTHNTEVCALAAKSGAIDVIMLSVNPAYDMLPASDNVNDLFEETTFNRTYKGIDKKREELYALCRNEGVAITVMKPFAGGLLMDEKQTPFGSAMTPVQCIAYCLDRPAVAAVMAGAKSEKEVCASADYCIAHEKAKDYGAILASAPGSSFSGHCMYCGHCAPCSVKINIADVNKYYDLAISRGEVTETLREHYRLLSHHAGECVECGACEANCPFGVKIIEKMQKAAELFGE